MMGSLSIFFLRASRTLKKSRRVFKGLLKLVIRKESLGNLARRVVR
jgi:hypothetical protein